MDIQKVIIAEFNAEVERTRTMLNAIPNDADFNWKPTEKSRPLGQLAAHLAEMSGEWTLLTLNQDRLDANTYQRPPLPGNKAELLEKFEKNAAQSTAALDSFNPADWDKQWVFAAGEHVIIDQPKHEIWRSFVINHGAHHRGQLTVYLRLLGAGVPGTYGPSGDEM